MALDTNYILRLKRNETQFTEPNARVNALNSIKIQLSSNAVQPGEMMIVTYVEDGVENVVIGIKGLSNGYQLFEGASFDADGKLQLPKSIKDTIDSLDYTDTVEDNKYVVSVVQSNGKIAVNKQVLISTVEGNIIENKNGSVYLSLSSKANNMIEYDNDEDTKGIYLSNVMDCGTYVNPKND